MGYIDTFKTLYFASPPRMRNMMRFGYEKMAPLVGILSREVAIRALREKSAKCKTIDDHVNLVFSFGFSPFDIKPKQDKWEISQLMRILAKLAPKTVLEIGTARGGTFYLCTRVASPNAILISIDLPRGPFGGGYPEWKIPFYRSFGLASQKIHLLRANSHDETTLCEIEKILGGLEADFLFIDGDHTYDGVKKDFWMYGKLVRRGGIIALHDICPRSPEIGCEVDKFWLEIQDSYRYREIVRNWSQGPGIGVIFK